MTRIYVGGPMTGMPWLNYYAFQEAVRKLRGVPDNIVTNPVQLDIATYGPEMFYDNPDGDAEFSAFLGFDLRQCARIDMICLINSDVIALLPLWETSKGARAEKAVAEWLGLEIRYL